MYITGERERERERERGGEKKRDVHSLVSERDRFNK